MIKFLNFKTTVRFIVSIFVCLAAGLVGSIFTTPAIPGWYATLQKPSFSPPNFLFAPVWTTLYILMGISLALILNKKNKTAIIFFVVQLVLNSLWSILFFGLKSPKLAFVEIIFLWLAILITILKFFKISKLAGWLFVPYLLWVSYASVLNLTIVKLN